MNEVYDPATNTWETKASMPTARYGMTISVVDDKFYLIGGTKEGSNTRLAIDVNEVYDPVTDSWTTKADIPNEISGYRLTSAVADSKIYCIKSNSWIVNPKRINVYDPVNDDWSVKANSPLNQSCPTAVATVGDSAVRIYVFDGSVNQIYDPKVDIWTIGTTMITPRDYVSVAVIDYILYVIGGVIGLPSDLFTSAYLYPSAANEQYFPASYPKDEPTSSPTSEPLILEPF